MNKEEKFINVNNSINFDFASLYPYAMGDFTKDSNFMRELERIKLKRDRIEKLKRINNL